MRARATRQFWSCFYALPLEIQQQAEKNYDIWKANPHHPALKFKRIRSDQPIYSVRIGRSWRALAVLEAETATWFWIGSHSDYDHLISRL